MELKRDFPDTKIIAVSGGGHMGAGSYLEAAKKFGASYIFSKPFELKEFLDAVENAVEGSI